MGMEILVGSLIVALVGWLATTAWIKNNQRLSPATKRALIVPVWFPWMGFAMGAPIVQGDVPVAEALQAVLSFTLGMGMFLLMTRRRTRRS